MTPLKIHNCGSYALMEYFTCWKCVIFHAVTASCFNCIPDPTYLNARFAPPYMKHDSNNIITDKMYCGFNLQHKTYI